MEELIKKAQHGDKESFSKAVLMIKEECYKIAYCYLHNSEDSMDAICDAVEKALINIKKLKEPKYFKTWFTRIVINECKMQLRKRRKVIQMADELYTPEIKKMESKRRDGTIDLETALKELKPKIRLLIYLKYYLGYTLEDIAETMELPVGTVKTKIYSNLKVLRRQLEVKGG
ncbi:sigma-70 family RNA polymerase sigma factor [Natronospora cellulosivora (SeqCode)]